jgi:hypothetical protein
MQIYTKFVNFTGLYFPHFTTLPTHHCSFAHSKTLFLAAVLDFIFDLIKILSIAGITHCSEQIAIETRKLPLSISQFVNFS